MAWSVNIIRYRRTECTDHKNNADVMSMLDIVSKIALMKMSGVECSFGKNAISERCHNANASWGLAP